MRYRSWDVFRVGSWCLPASHEISNPWYSGDPAQRLSSYAYGAVTLYGGPFQATSASLKRRRLGPATPHPHHVSMVGSVCPTPLSVAPTQGIPIGFFSSPYLDASVRGVPAPCPERRWLPTGRKSHSAIPGSTATCAYPGLIAACHGLPRRPSRAIHQVASLCRALFGVSSSPRNPFRTRTLGRLGVAG